MDRNLSAGCLELDNQTPCKGLAPRQPVGYRGYPRWIKFQVYAIWSINCNEISKHGGNRLPEQGWGVPAATWTALRTPRAGRGSPHERAGADGTIDITKSTSGRRPWQSHDPVHEYFYNLLIIKRLYIRLKRIQPQNAQEIYILTTPRYRSGFTHRSQLYREGVVSAYIAVGPVPLSARLLAGRLSAVAQAGGQASNPQVDPRSYLQSLNSLLSN